MWIVFVITGVIVLLMIALLAVYLDLRSTVEILKNTINWQNERYLECLKGWDRSIKLLNEARSLSEQLLDELNDIKEE